MTKTPDTALIDIINKPIITDKTTKLLEQQQYCFSVSKNSCKRYIKKAIEKTFNVKVIKVNTMNTPKKKRTVGKFTGQKPQYKKTIVTLAAEDRIELFLGH